MPYKRFHATHRVVMRFAQLARANAQLFSRHLQTVVRSR
jgi:hypothetical protein